MYTYTVVAVSGDDPARAVVVLSNKGQASVTANIPAAGTSSIELDANYKTKITAAENTTASVTDGTLYVTYPATAGFKYKVEALNKSAVAAGVTSFADSSTEKANYKEDYKANATATLTTAGTYEVYVTVQSASALYPAYTVDTGVTVTVANIGEDTSNVTKNVSATYKDGSESAVRVSWTPAKLVATGKNTATANYKVYRSSATNATLVAVTGTVTAGGKDSTPLSDVYFIDDTVSDNTIAYTYYVVHTDGTHFGAYLAANNQTTLSAYTLTATSIPVFDTDTKAYIDGADNLGDCIKVKVKKASDSPNQTLALSYVKLEKATSTYGSADFTSVALANYDGLNESYIAYISTGITAGTYLLKLTASETGKKGTTVYTTVTVNAAAVPEAVTTAAFNSASTKILIVDTTINANTNALSNYAYSLRKVVTTTNAIYTDTVTVTDTEVVAAADLTLAKLTTEEQSDVTSGWTSVSVGNDDLAKIISAATDGNTQYYVVKTLKSDTTKFTKTKVN